MREKNYCPAFVYTLQTVCTCVLIQLTNRPPLIAFIIEDPRRHDIGSWFVPTLYIYTVDLYSLLSRKPSPYSVDPFRRHTLPESTFGLPPEHKRLSLYCRSEISHISFSLSVSEQLLCICCVRETSEGRLSSFALFFCKVCYTRSHHVGKQPIWAIDIFREITGIIFREMFQQYNQRGNTSFSGYYS